MSIRLRLALWYTAFLATMFVLFAPAVYFAQERVLMGEVDRWLGPVADRVLHSVADNARALQNLKTPSSSSSDLSASQVVAALSAYQDLDLERFTSPGVSVELLDANGRVIARSPNLQGETVPVPDEAFAAAWWGPSDSFTSEWNRNRYRGYLAPIPGDREPQGFVLAIRSLSEVDAALTRIRYFLMAGNLLGLGLAIGVGWLIARRALRPIDDITHAARSIAQSQDFGRRIEVGKSRDEVGQMATTFNEMLASLDSAYRAQRRFVADASHELRSPLTSIKSNIDIMRRAIDAPAEDRAEMLADVASEVDRMSRLTSDLLLLARADAGHKVEMGKVDLAEVLSDLRRQMANRSESVELEVAASPKTCVTGNQTWLKQLVLILVDNALKYTPSGGKVRVAVRRNGADAVLTVSDNGIGISEEDLPHVFERFYRADKARARDEGGAGLGLAIAQWIAEEHHAVLSVESAPGRGTTFTVRMGAAG